MHLARGSKMAIAGLLIGMTVGATVLLLKSWLQQEIVSAIDDEVQASCQCTFAFDSLNLSLATLSATMTNARVMERGVTKLSFHHLNAKVSLAEITQRHILLSKVDLYGGIADGVGPDSVAFRFIDHLTQPLPPEKQRPNRWRVMLDALEVFPAKMTEPLRGGSIEASGITVFVRRLGDRFVLTPRVENLALRLNSSKDRATFKEMPLGSVESSIVIDDLVTRFNSLVVKKGDNTSKAQAAVENKNDQKISGPVHYNLGFDYLDIPHWLQGRVTGKGELSASLGNPTITGTLEAVKDYPPNIAIAGVSLGNFYEIHGATKVDVNHGSPFVEIKDLRAANESFVVESLDTLLFSPDVLRGKLSVKSGEFSVGPVTSYNAAFDLSFAGPTGEISTTANGDIGMVRVGGFELGPLNAAVSLAGEKLIITAKSPVSDYLNAEVAFHVPEVGDSYIESGQVTLNSLPLLGALSVAPFPALSGNAALSGLAEPIKIQADGDFKVQLTENPASAVSGDVKLLDGKVELRGTNAERSLAGKAHFDFFGDSGELSASAQDLALVSLRSNLKCGGLTGAFDYRFAISEIGAGNGSLKVAKAHLGCEPYTVILSDAATLTISAGTLAVPAIVIQGFHTGASLEGSLSLQTGYNLNAKGSLSLGSLVPYIANADDLRGELSAEAKIVGELRSPKVIGEAVLKDGELAFATPDVSAHTVQGTFQFDEQSISFDDLTGSLNGGEFSVRGTIVPTNMSQSRVETTLKNIQVSPLEDTNLTFSGTTSLISGIDGKPTLTGQINFDEGDVKRDFNPSRLVLKTVAGLFLPTTAAQRSSGGSELPDVDLDLKLTAGRNLFVTTTFLGAELGADISVTGTLKSPIVRGVMKTIRGWLGLKGNRFEVISGQVEFKPEASEPLLEVVAEGSVRSSTGENIIVIVEASGPLRSPRISLSSDRGLSHDELLLLVTSNRNLLGRTRTNTIGEDFGDVSSPILSNGPFTSLGSFFSNLTKIDTLTFEPIYSPYTGYVEPAIVARKRLTDKVSVIGESMFGTVSNSRAGLVYSFAPDLNLSTTIGSISTRQNSALGADLTYTILSDKDLFTLIQMQGEHRIDKETILTAVRASESSRFRPDDLDRLESSIKDFYNSRGMLHATAAIGCENNDGFYCRTLKIKVHEGAVSYIKAILFLGQDPRTVLGSKFELPPVLDKTADASSLQEVEQKLTAGLRSEGYIGARVTARYVPSKVPESVELQISTELKQAVTFNFIGNEAFSSEEFVNSLDLFKRNRPFGNNTIKVLLDNIQRMYREKGYFYASARVSDQESNDRITYTISITEETRALPGKVTIEGNNAIKTEKILKLVNEYGLLDPNTITNPTAIVPDQLEAGKNAIAQVLINEGYPQAQVDYRLNPNASGSLIDIVYTISEGDLVKASTLKVTGLPAGVIEPKLSRKDASFPKINAYIAALVDNLRSAGYLYPSATADPDAATNAVAIEVEAGEPTKVESIEIVGLDRINEDIIYRHLHVHTGDLWNSQAINSTKRDLLKLGLFSRVDIGPEDGKLDALNEKLLIRLYERELRTLEIGGGANSEFGVHVFGEAIDKSTFKDGRSLALRVDTYFDQANVNPGNGGGASISQGFTSLRYLDPDFLGTALSYSNEFRLQRQDLSTQEFDLDRVSLNNFWYRQFPSGLNFSGGHTILVDNLDNVTPGAQISSLDSGQVRIGYLSTSLALDRRDDPLIPTSGYTLRLEPKLAAGPLGSQGSFASVVGKSTAILPLSAFSPRWSIGFGAGLGYSKRFGDTDEIPITQRFYLGGRSTVRGFKENSLGPRGADGAVIGGDTLVYGSSQLQYRAIDSLSVHTFLDSGTVFLREKDYSLDELRYSTGLGLRYLSPIGPIGFDIGHPLDRRSNEDSLRFHFSVGSTF